jgi:hypothetical protein
MEAHMVPEEQERRDEIESIDRLSKLMLEEKDVARFTVLARELKELLQREQNRLRWLCLPIRDEKDKETFDRLTEELEELLEIRRQGLRLAASDSGAN